MHMSAPAFAYQRICWMECWMDAAPRPTIRVSIAPKSVEEESATAGLPRPAAIGIREPTLTAMPGLPILDELIANA
jgi:hypothetical protein